MAFKVITAEKNMAQGKTLVVGTADTEADIATVSTDYAAGSVVLVTTANDFHTYVLSASGVWTKKV